MIDFKKWSQTRKCNDFDHTKNVELTERLKWITNLIFFTMTCPRHAHIQGRIQDLKLGGHT
jgi:hypothetical protein